MKRKKVSNSDLFPSRCGPRKKPSIFPMPKMRARGHAPPVAIRAFAGMRDIGMDPSDIAARFGYSES
ncbi:chromosome partitioning protein ParB, partial [Sphingobium rhizovicinum]